MKNDPTLFELELRLARAERALRSITADPGNERLVRCETEQYWAEQVEEALTEGRGAPST